MAPRHCNLLPRFLASLFALTTGCVVAADLPPQPKEIAPPSIRELSDGQLAIGPITLNRTSRSVRFPAAINATNGLVEYLLVHHSGKTHESLLKTDVEPYHLQIAMLLLGAKGANPALLTNAPSGGPIHNSELVRLNPPPIPGTPVTIDVEWKSNGKTIRRPIESLLYNRKTKKSMSSGPFTFSGSIVWENKFIAQIEGSIISVITDSTAIFNNPRKDRDADDVWYVQENILPPDGTPAFVEIRLVKSNDGQNEKKAPAKRQ